MVGAITSDICFLFSVGEPANLVFFVTSGLADISSMTHTTDNYNF
jgi:hypothetical protein